MTDGPRGTLAHAAAPRSLDATAVQAGLRKAAPLVLRYRLSARVVGPLLLAGFAAVAWGSFSRLTPAGVTLFSLAFAGLVWATVQNTFELTIEEHQVETARLWGLLRRQYPLASVLGARIRAPSAGGCFPARGVVSLLIEGRSGVLEVPPELRGFSRLVEVLGEAQESL